MMEGINLYSIDYYKKTVFTGSYRGLCFRVYRAERPLSDISGELGDVMEEDSPVVEGGGEEMVDCLEVKAWKGPFIMEKTDEEVYTETFAYSDEGLDEANEWLEQKQKEVV
ncbi:MAG: hypothetical protein IJM01_00695 [Eubacterium sp.]|nr:hypothetical protein [Eubacterium sp.]